MKTTSSLKLFGIVLLVFGALILGTNILFRAMQWPKDMFQGHITGPVLMGLGIVFLVLHAQQSKK